MVKVYKKRIFLLSHLFLCLASHPVWRVHSVKLLAPELFCPFTLDTAGLSFQQEGTSEQQVTLFSTAGWGHCVAPARSAILSSLYPFVLAMLEMPITTTAPARFSPDGYQSEGSCAQFNHLGTSPKPYPSGEFPYTA